MYKIEPHMHTAETSKCAQLPAAEMIKLYKDRGYSTVIVTDHYTENNFNRFDGEEWADKAERFLLGYRNAKKAAEELDITVLLGIELTFSSPLGRNDYLVYGMTDEFLKKNRELYKFSHTDFHTFAKDNGMLVIQAHPFRDGVCIPTPGFVDGIEVYNSNPRHKDYSEKSEELAASHKDFYLIGGSDSHRTEDVGLSGICSDVPIKTIEDFISLVKSRKVNIIR